MQCPSYRWLAEGATRFTRVRGGPLAGKALGVGDLVSPDAGGDARTVEQVGGQADDRVEQVVLAGAQRHLPKFAYNEKANLFLQGKRIDWRV